MKNFLKIIGAVSLGASLSFAAVVAEVDGKKITDTDLNQYLHAITGNPKLNYNKLNPNAKQKLLRDYIMDNILISKASKMKNTYAYKVLSNKLAINLWLKEQAKKIKVTDKEIQDFYNKNKDKFKTKDGKTLPLKQVKPFIKNLLVNYKLKAQIDKIVKQHKITIKK